MDAPFIPNAQKPADEWRTGRLTGLNARYHRTVAHKRDAPLIAQFI